MDKKGIKVNKDFIKDFIAKKGMKITALSKEMGHDQSYITNMLRSGSMPQTELKLLCLLTGMKEEDAVKTDNAPKKLEELSDQNTELIISYIQDLGKIHTDTLRELKELKDTFGKLMTSFNESQENHRVEAHKDSQQLLNYFKYGRK